MMKQFIVFNMSGNAVVGLNAESADDVEKHPKFIEAMKHQNGRLFTIVEIAQTKRYERPL